MLRLFGKSPETPPSPIQQSPPRLHPNGLPVTPGKSIGKLCFPGKQKKEQPPSSALERLHPDSRVFIPFGRGTDGVIMTVKEANELGLL